jgi:hypothetical protein
MQTNPPSPWWLEMLLRPFLAWTLVWPVMRGLRTDGQYKIVLKSNEKNTNQILLAQTPKRQMEKHAAGQNGQKLKAGQNGKSCSRAKWQTTKSRAKWKILQPGKMTKSMKCRRPIRVMAKNQAGQLTPSIISSLP